MFLFFCGMATRILSGWPHEKRRNQNGRPIDAVETTVVFPVVCRPSSTNIYFYLRMPFCLRVCRTHTLRAPDACANVTAFLVGWKMDVKFCVLV